MNKRELALLEKAFSLEIEAALNGVSDLMKTKSKLADDLVIGGYLIKAKDQLCGRFPVTIEGYRLTDLGRMTYCKTCE